MNTDSQKSTVEKVKDQAAETWENVKDKADYVAGQVQDRTKAQYYETKADVNKNIESVKDQVKNK